MYKYIIKNSKNEVTFSSKLFYTYKEAYKNGLEHLEVWELLFNGYGKVEVIEV